MKVSIITIVYNNRDCIADCIRSVLSQSYKRIEHIVIDGGSTDGTQAIIEPYIPQLGYYASEKDNGLYDALNKGIRQASGDVVGILHSDDLFYSSTSVATIVHAFESSHADLVYADGRYVLRDDVNALKRVYPGKPYKKRYLYNGWVPLHTTIYVKREIFDKYGFYDEEYRIASDYDMTLRWLSNNDISKYYLRAFVVNMRLGGKSTTMGLQKLKSSEDFSIMNKYGLPGYYTLAMKIARKIPQYLFANRMDRRLSENL